MTTFFDQVSVAMTVAFKIYQNVYYDIKEHYEIQICTYANSSIGGNCPWLDKNMSWVLFRERNTNVCTECLCTSCDQEIIN